MSNRHIGFRGWYYLRTGWSTYFAFIFAAVNTLVVTYYLAIEKIPPLEAIFPTFFSYVLILSVIGVPLLIITGYVHFQKSHAYGSEAEIAAEQNPYFYKAAPGWVRDVQWPLFLKFSELLIKLCNNEKLTESELQEITELQKKISVLMKGGSIGSPRNRTI
jgi:hypothetical protein